MEATLQYFLRSYSARAYRIALFFCFLAVAAFAQNPVPQIVGSVKPSAVAPGNGAFTLTVYGANFVSGAVVNWNGQARVSTFVSARELHAQILALDVAANGAGMISVTNPRPGGGISSSSWAQVEVHAPTAVIAYSYPYFAPTAANNEGGPTVLADFNGDNKLDRMYGKAMTMGRGDATFRLTQVIANYQPYWGTVYGDFDGDGKLDIAYVAGDDVNNGPGQTIQIALGDGTGIFNQRTRLRSLDGAGFIELTAGDFNRDGKLDLIAFEGTNSGKMDVFLGNGDGTFTQSPKSYTGLIYPNAAQAGDFNGDGKLDLAIWSGEGLYIATGNGDGTFQYPGTLVASAPLYPCSFDMENSALVNDFDGDGRLDVAVGYEYYGNEIEVFLGNGDGTFKSPAIYPVTFNGFFTAAAGDFNSDGKVDMAVSQDGQFSIFLGNGDGTFQPAQVITLPGKVQWNGDVGFVVGDFNGDGLVDFIFNGFDVFRQE